MSRPRGISFKEAFEWHMPPKPDGDKCWLWTSCVDSSGYGHFWWQDTMVKAHRSAFEIHTGRPIPPGLFVCHRCDTPRCCNVDHMFLGTHMDNVQDRDQKDRVLHGLKHGKTKLTEDQVREIYVSNETSIVLAKRYGIFHTSVRKIKHGGSWRRLTQNIVRPDKAPTP